MNIRLTFLIIQICLCSYLFGQKTSSIRSFLATAQQENNVQLYQQKIDFQTNTNHALPRIDEIEFRTETNDFDLSEQEYVLRLSPNSEKQVAAQKDFHQSSIYLQQTEQQIALKNALVQRYKWIVKWLELKQDIADKEALKAIYKDIYTVYIQQVDDLDFDIQDVVKAEEDILEMDYDLHKLNASQAELIALFQRLSNGSDRIQIEENSLISIPQIVSKMAIQSLSDTNHLALQRKQNRIDLIDKEYAIEWTELNNPINYVQVKFGGRGSENLREFVSIGAGLNLPVRNDYSLDLNELTLDKLEEEGEMQILKNRLTSQQAELVQNVRLLLERKSFLQEQIENSQAKYVLERLKETDGANPLDMLQLQEIILKKEQTIARIDILILKNYINWLEVSDVMMEQPLRNHLTDVQELLPID